MTDSVKIVNFCFPAKNESHLTKNNPKGASGQGQNFHSTLIHQSMFFQSNDSGIVNWLSGYTGHSSNHLSFLLPMGCRSLEGVE